MHDESSSDILAVLSILFLFLFACSYTVTAIEGRPDKQQDPEEVLDMDVPAQGAAAGPVAVEGATLTVSRSGKSFAFVLEGEAIEEEDLVGVLASGRIRSLKLRGEDDMPWKVFKRVALVCRQAGVEKLLPVISEEGV